MDVRIVKINIYLSNLSVCENYKTMIILFKYRIYIIYRYAFR